MSKENNSCDRFIFNKVSIERNKASGVFLFIGGSLVTLSLGFSFYSKLALQKCLSNVISRYANGYLLDYQCTIQQPYFLTLYHQSKVKVIYYRISIPPIRTDEEYINATDEELDCDAMEQETYEYCKYNLIYNPQYLSSTIPLTILPELKKYPNRSYIGPIPLFDTVFIQCGMCLKDTLNKAKRYLNNACNALKPGGYLIIQELSSSQWKIIKNMLYLYDTYFYKTKYFYPIHEILSELREFELIYSYQTIIGIGYVSVLKKKIT